MIERRYVYLFLVFLCIFAQLAAADDRDSFEYVAGTGIEIHTNPQGAKVFINGIERGITPFFNYDLKADTYIITIRRETFADREFEAIVLNNSCLVVTMEIEVALGYVDISVHREAGSPDALPFHPQVSARAADKTISSITLSHNNGASVRLPVGKQEIQARAFGWEDASVSVSVKGQGTAIAEIYIKPAVFKIEKAAQSRRRFNPLNSSSLGLTEYRFEVSAPGTGVIKILDTDANIVYTRPFEQFNTWIQETTWNGTDSNGNILPQGTYLVVIEASPLPQFSEEEVVKTLRLRTEINYSINIFPLSLESVVSGLTFAPMPYTLPAKSFQANASLLFSKYEPLGIGFPFKFNLRISPIERLEFTAILNINPYIEHRIGWGLSGSAKYNILNGLDSVPLYFSAGISYSWASGFRREATGEYPLGPGEGAGFYTPLSLELGDFSLVFCPAAFWHLQRIFRGGEKMIPELLLSTGLMYRGNWLNTGISARYEIDFNESKNSRFLTGAEINLFPAPSNIIYSIQSGVWLRDSNLGFYAGFGIGFIY